MTKTKLKELKQLYYTKLLYQKFLNAYALEGSRGYRPDLRNSVEANYKFFMAANEKLSDENKIESSIKLELTA